MQVMGSHVDNIYHITRDRFLMNFAGKIIQTAPEIAKYLEIVSLLIYVDSRTSRLQKDRSPVSEIMDG